MKLSGADPDRIYLTGHSMGGHGTWHLAANDPDRWAAIAPSAGWISFDTYGGRLPSAGESHIARDNYALTAETDDDEWLLDASGISANQYAYFYNGGGTTSSLGHNFQTTSYAYRCWIPN